MFHIPTWCWSFRDRLPRCCVPPAVWVMADPCQRAQGWQHCARLSELARAVNVLTVSDAKVWSLGSIKPAVRLGAEGQPGDKTVTSCSTVRSKLPFRHPNSMQRGERHVRTETHRGNCRSASPISCLLWATCWWSGTVADRLGWTLLGAQITVGLDKMRFQIQEVWVWPILVCISASWSWCGFGHALRGRHLCH